jgi:hypothetical protein
MHLKNIGDCVGRQGLAIDATFEPLPSFLQCLFTHPRLKGDQ